VRGRLASAAAAAVSLVLVAVPSFRAEADVPRYGVKPVDGSRWGLARFRAGRMIRGACAHRACLALTFDDGPDEHTTSAILDILDQHGVRATFFVTGHRFDGHGAVAVRNRATLATTFARGHLVGNHTYHHYSLDSLDAAALAYEIDRTDSLIAQVLGERTFLFRAPYGVFRTQAAMQAVYSRGLTPVFWTIDTRDWEARSPEQVLATFRTGLDDSPNGGVVLFHDTLERTVQALPLVFADVEARNVARRRRGEPLYEFVGLDELWQPVRPER